MRNLPCLVRSVTDAEVLCPPGVLSSTQAPPALEEVAGLSKGVAPAPPCVWVEGSGFKGNYECVNSSLEFEFNQSTHSPVTTLERFEAASPAGSYSLQEPSQVPKVVNLRRSQRVAANWHPSAHSAIYALIELGADDDTEGDPTSHRDSLRLGHCQEWKTAMREEFKSLEDNETWSIIKRSSVGHGVHPVGCKCGFRQKGNPDGSIHFKARLVIKGYEQQIFGETFAPVERLTSRRLVLALATLNR